MRDGHNVKRKSNGWNSAKSHPSPPPEESKSSVIIGASQRHREPKNHFSDGDALDLLINEGEMSSQEWLHSDLPSGGSDRVPRSRSSQQPRAERSFELRAIHATAMTELPGTQLGIELEEYDWDKFSQDF